MIDIDPAAGAGALSLSAFISSTLAPGGSEALLAWLVARESGSPMGLLWVATLGNTVGALSTYALGFALALGWPVQRWARGRREQAVGVLRRWGSPALLLSWLPVVGDALCLAAGWLRLPPARAAAYIAIGKALRYALVVWVFA
jgi:membrane protein YqaA with SNARE-associated domain